MFTTALVLEEAPAIDFWIVQQPLVWTGQQEFPAFTVPVGFQTDLASIPRALRNLPAFDPNGKSRRAAVGHDWLYWWQGWHKSLSDKFLHAAMLLEGCTVQEADAFYAAVALFGHDSWDDGTKRGLASHFDTPLNYQLYLGSINHV